MDAIFDVVERLSHHAFSLTEYAAAAFYVLTALLLMLTYGLARQDWAEISAWASLASVAVAIHFMVVSWREVARPDLLDMPGTVARHPDGAGRRFRDCPDCPEMVVIQPGVFIMGSDVSDATPDQRPARKIMLARRFAVARQAVTPVELKAFTRDTGHVLASCGNDGICLGWRDATAYLDWLRRRSGQSFRLVSTAEWNYVARAGDSIAAEPSAGVVRASLQSQSSVEGNRFGVAGMTSGAKELVADCWSPALDVLPSDGRAYSGSMATACAHRVVMHVEASTGAAVFRRRPLAGGQPMPCLGFRVARDMAASR